jgi:hypothetical protein
MKTVYLLYRKTREFASYPFAIDHDVNYVNKMSRCCDDVGYVELPYKEACYVYDNKLEVLEYVRVRRMNL